MSKEKITFPFGDKLFIGIVKFYDYNKEFGFVVSNNYGMEQILREEEQGFYIDNNSWKTAIPEKRAVIFRPAYRGSKLRAENVREFNLKTDWQLVLDYFENNNYIQFEEKVKRYSVNTYGRRHFDGYLYEHQKYNILKICGFSRYQLLNYYAEFFKESHDFGNLLLRINKIVESMEGEEIYYKQLKSNYVDKEKEYVAWYNIFSLLDITQCKELLQLHPSVQMFAPNSVLLDFLDNVDEKWGVSPAVLTALCEYKEAKKIKKIEDLIDSGLTGSSRDEMEDILRIYEKKISSDRLLALKGYIEKATLAVIQEKLSMLSAHDTTFFLEIAKSISSEYKLLSKDGCVLFRDSLYSQYNDKLIKLVKSVISLDWNDYKRTSVLYFLKEDSIISTEGFTDPLLLFKDAAKRDYIRLFVQTEETTAVFNSHKVFDNQYAFLFDEKEHSKLLEKIQEDCISYGGLFSIIRLFSFLGKKLPDCIKERFLALPIEDIVTHVKVLDMFEDSGKSLVGSIVDKIISTGELFFHNEENTDQFPYISEMRNKSFINSLISICGQSSVEQHFVRLQEPDRIDLFNELQLNIITNDELKKYLINTKNPDYTHLLLTPTGIETILNIIIECDCSTGSGIHNAIVWLDRLVGEEPSDYYERTEWNKKKSNAIFVIGNSQNEYLKVLVWAKYFQSGGKIGLLKDVFYLYPTELQIRVVKKFFSLMALGKFTPSLGKLKDVLGCDIHNLSLPIEIVFKYLSLKIEDPNAHMTDAIMLTLFKGREDYGDWFMINKMLNPCNGRRYLSNNDRTGVDDSFRNFGGTIQKCKVMGQEVFRVHVSRKQLTMTGNTTHYNNKSFNSIKEYISISFGPDKYKIYRDGEDLIYDFELTEEKELLIMAEVYRLKLDDDRRYYDRYELDENAERFCCECRVSDSLDNTKRVFLWCRNRKCYHRAPHYHTSEEWEMYTILDFMRILGIPVDYVNQRGKVTKFGQYIIFSTYMLFFHEFLEHLKCRKCGKLMEPCNISNFARSSITEFSCQNKECELVDTTVYLNKCFNSKCNSIIDSRDSKQCPNGSYICEKCGACCATYKFRERLDKLQMTGGYVSQWLIDAIRGNIGHWENRKLYCSSCGSLMENDRCTCGYIYNQRIRFE